MYQDPKHLKIREIKVRLDENTYQLVEAVANYNRTQRAVIARELVEEGLKNLIETQNKANKAAV